MALKVRNHGLARLPHLLLMFPTYLVSDFESPQLANSLLADEQPPAKKVKTAEASTEEVPNGHAAEEQEEEEEEEVGEDDAEADDDEEADAAADEEEETADKSAPAKDAVKPTEAPAAGAEATEAKAVAAGGDEA